MTRDVLIRISGFQMLEDEQDNIEVIAPGDYFLKNGKHYILYDEIIEGFEGVVKNTIKVAPDCMDIRKSGISNVRMSFEADKKNISSYATPLGEMMIGISTNQISVAEAEDSLKIRVDYSLDINYEHVSDHEISIDVYSKEKADLNLGA